MIFRVQLLIYQIWIIYRFTMIYPLLIISLLVISINLPEGIIWWCRNPIFRLRPPCWPRWRPLPWPRRGPCGPHLKINLGRIQRKTMGKPWENGGLTKKHWDFMAFHGIHGINGWFMIAMLMQLGEFCSFIYIYIQWPFQDPKLEVPTIYKAYVRPM